MTDLRRIAMIQGCFNLLGGAWPLLSMRSFEAVYGPKVDRWLECTVAGLLVTTGAAQVASTSESQLRTARLLGIGTAGTLLAVDLVNLPRGRLRWTYAQDALCEAGLLVAWAARQSRRVTPSRQA